MKKYKLKKGTTDYHAFTDINMSVEDRRILNVGDIWMNSAKCRKCEDVIVSANKHDYVSCKCGAIALDGGSWYSRNIGNPEDFESLLIPFNKQGNEKED